MNTRNRVGIAAAPHLPAIMPSIVVLLTADDRLPDEIAMHFTLGGAADGFFDRWAVVAILVAFAVGSTAVFALLAHRHARLSPAPIASGDPGRQLAGTAWAVAGIFGTVTYFAIAANLDLADAADAVLPGWSIPVALVGAGLAAAAGAALVPRPPAATAGPEAVEALQLARGELAGWSRTVRAPWAVAAGAVVGVGGAALGATVNGVVVLSSLAAGALVALLGRARVTVDRRGLRVCLGPFRWPRVRVPAEDIVSATAADVSPTQFGGWGYRILPGARGVIIRSGPALIVTRRSGGRFVVTVDDPTTAAGLLNGFAERRG